MTPYFRATPESSQVSYAKYDPATKIMTVSFKSGGMYIYKDVPEGIWVDAIETESFGKFLNAKVKGKFEYEKI